MFLLAFRITQTHTQLQGYINNIYLIFIFTLNVKDEISFICKILNYATNLPNIFFYYLKMDRWVETDDKFQL
jgi:hypothetical protein